MSQDLYVCAIDLAKFRAVLGSGDQDLVRHVITKMHREIQGYDQYFLGEPGVLPLGLVITRVIHGDLTSPCPFQFEGAAAIIADAMGTPLPVTTLREAKAAFCTEVDGLLVAVRQLNRISAAALPSIGEILERGPFLPIPLDPARRLGTGYLAAREVARAVRVMTRERLKWPVDGRRREWRGLAREALREYGEWLAAAAELRAGLFIHR